MSPSCRTPLASAPAVPQAATETSNGAARLVWAQGGSRHWTEEVSGAQLFLPAFPPPLVGSLTASQQLFPPLPWEPLDGIRACGAPQRALLQR